MSDKAELMKAQNYAEAMESRVLELERELTAAKKDAERYRWLRNKSPGQFEQPIVVTQVRADDHMKYVGPLAYSCLDAAIDAAMESK